jgi:hypothetical protein
MESFYPHDPEAEYQRLAARFHEETGLLAPGKVPGALPDEHKAAWWAWWGAHRWDGVDRSKGPGWRVPVPLAPAPIPQAAPGLPQAGLFW